MIARATWMQLSDGERESLREKVRQLAMDRAVLLARLSSGADWVQVQRVFDPDTNVPTHSAHDSLQTIPYRRSTEFESIENSFMRFAFVADASSMAAISRGDAVDSRSLGGERPVVHLAEIELIKADDADEVDHARTRVQTTLRAGDQVLADRLILVARTHPDHDIRARVLSTLLGARCTALEARLVDLLREVFHDDDEWLVVVAIAAAADLSGNGRLQLRESIQQFARSGSARVQRAAKAFLAANP
jgi:hypothetical protein